MDLLARYSNRQEQVEALEDVLCRVMENDQADLPGLGPESKRTRWWRVTDRLSDAEIDTLAERRRAGAKLAHLALEYGISISSVQRLCRQHGTHQGEVGPEAGV